MIRLKCLKGILKERVFEFDTSSIIMGRGKKCDIVIKDLSCSAKHVKVEKHDDCFQIHDLASTNGLFVNKIPVESSHIVYGDKFSLGTKNLFVFLSDIQKDHGSGAESDTVAVANADGNRNTEEEEEEVIIHDTVAAKEVVNRFGTGISPLKQSEPEIETVVSELHRKNHQMSVLYNLTQMVNNTFNTDDLYSQITDSILESNSNIERVFLYVRQDNSDSLRLADSNPKTAEEDVCVSKKILDQVMYDKSSVLGTDERKLDCSSEQESKPQSFMCVPLIAGDNLKGILYAESQSQSQCFTVEDLTLLSVTGNVSASAIHNASLFEELQVSFYEIICSLSNALQAKNKYTRGHSDRVAYYSIGIGKHLNLSAERINRV